VAETTEIPFEATPGGELARRTIARRRALYYRDDLRGPLPLGHIEPRALPYETYRQAFTPGLFARAYRDRVDEALLTSEGGYVREDGVFWAPSGRRIFDRAAFYQPAEAVDPFGARYRVRYDDAALLPVETEDPLANKVSAANDYRVLSPRLV